MSTTIMPTLNTPIIIEIFEKLLKEYSEFNNYKTVEKLIYGGGRECLAAFIDILKTVKSVSFTSFGINMQFTKYEINSRLDEFPLGFWKRMIPYVTEVVVSCDYKNLKPFLKALEHSTVLRKVESRFVLDKESWGYLLNSSVTEIISLNDGIVEILKLEKSLYSRLEKVHIMVYSDFKCFTDVISSIPCKELKISYHADSWIPFQNMIMDSIDNVASMTVEKFEVDFSVMPDIPVMAELGLTNILEGMSNIFPNLKEAKICLRILDDDDLIFPFVPHPEFVQIIVSELSKQIQNAEISYKLSLYYERTNIVNMDDITDELLIGSFKDNGFTRKGSRTREEWIYFSNISDGKKLDIKFILDEKERDSVRYGEMIDDLGLDLEIDDYDHEYEDYYDGDVDADDDELADFNFAEDY